ncbi:DUF664 domain-containing protein [Dactylosporangium sp. NPDC005555]|uniref:mycothiol transferase n=1 Tax=Dactylosporangium sp. NPDC005555 TaxID=3154889 RepID=UPI0033AFD243
MSALLPHDRRRVRPRRHEAAPGGGVSLRFIYLLLFDDFARHAGHADILREQFVARGPGIGA